MPPDTAEKRHSLPLQACPDRLTVKATPARHGCGKPYCVHLFLPPTVPMCLRLCVSVRAGMRLWVCKCIDRFKETQSHRYCNVPTQNLHEIDFFFYLERSTPQLHFDGVSFAPLKCLPAYYPPYPIFAISLPIIPVLNLYSTTKPT